MDKPSIPASLVVLQSTPQPRPTTNPYLIQLFESLNAVPGVTVSTFSWPAALFGRYDVFHVHWPENLPHGRSAAKSFARRALTRLLLLRLRVTRTPLVRTLHNVDRPADRTRAEYRVLRAMESRTALGIRLNEWTPVPERLPIETIPHGHYVDWFARYVPSSPVPGRLTYFGLIRRYKNVARLVGVATTLPRTFSLRVAGSPTSAQLVDEIIAAKGDDSRILLDFSFQTDADLVDVVTQGELTVLPYREMHNSGSVLASLSLQRPVLVQNNVVNRSLSDEVGEGWIQLYDGELSAADILAAHSAVTSAPPPRQPDLGGRGWPGVAARHVSAYRRAIELTRR